MAKLTPLMMFLLTALPGKAQICSPYTLVNATASCTVDVTYKIFTGSNCNTTCWGTVTIPASGSFTIPAGCITPGASDIEVIVDYTGSGTVTPALNFGSAGGGGPWACYNNNMGALQMSSGPGPICCFTPAIHTVTVFCTTTLIQ